MPPQDIKEILSEDHLKSIDDMSRNIAIVQKLNEELTAENIRLLEELEKQKPFTALENNIPDMIGEIQSFKYNRNVIDNYDKKIKTLLIGTITIFSIAILAIFIKHC